MDDPHIQPTPSETPAAPAAAETAPPLGTLALGVAAPFGVLALLAAPAVVQALIH
jgi:hypothetical protein